MAKALLDSDVTCLTLLRMYIQAKETAVKELASEQDKRKALESLVQQLAQKLLEKQQTDQNMTNQLLQVAFFCIIILFQGCNAYPG